MTSLPRDTHAPVQMGEFRSWAVMGDWEGRYETMDPAYERAQLLGFRAMVAQGRVHQGVKPVWWSPATRTALAEAELEYHDDHVSQSAYVSFPFVSTQCDALKPLVGRVSAVAWTTTPWTLPANRALCVHEELPYVVLDGGAQGFLLVAEALAAPFSAAMGHPQALRVVARVTGAQLLGSHVKHPVHEADASVVLGANFVTTDTGTGVVHCAPGHGQDDYLACVEAGIAPFSPVDDAGNYDETVGVASLVGLPVLGAGGERVVQMLLASGRLLSVKPFTHKYPYDWRSKTPVLVRSTPQWFLDSRDLQAKALAAIEHVRFVPASGKSKFARTLSGRKEDWCISRQRFWGVPLPAFYHRDTRRALLSVDTVDAFLARMEATKSGVSVWWTSSVAELLPPAMRHQAEEWEKGSDTLDVWMDSGLSWSYLRERGLALPVDMVLEGTDQYRGWFQSSLLTWLAAGNSGAPWKSVVVHGFCLDSQGVKMSKASRFFFLPANLKVSVSSLWAT